MEIENNTHRTEENLREFCLKLGWSPRDLLRRLGLESQFENGKIPTWKEICHELSPGHWDLLKIYELEMDSIHIESPLSKQNQNQNTDLNQKPVDHQ